MSVDHLASRRAVLDALREELVGPAPAGAPVDCTLPIVFEVAAEAYRPRTELGTGEEILQRDNPGRRYGVGVLYPAVPHAPASDDVRSGNGGGVHGAGTAGGTGAVDEVAAGADGDAGRGAELLDPAAAAALDVIGQRSIPVSDEGPDDPELDLSGANTYQPSSVAVSFLADLAGGDDVWVRIQAGRYRRIPVTVAGKDRVWWVRTSLTFEGRVPSAQLAGDAVRLARVPVQGPTWAGLDVAIEVLSRPQPLPGERLVTVCVVNRTAADGPEDEHTLFQVGFGVTVGPPNAPRPAILPYPTAPADTLDDEEAGIELLYRHVQTFAVGHGCAADWARGPDAGPNAGRATMVRAECLPAHETPSMTPDAERPDGERLDVSMHALAGLDPLTDGMDTLESVVGHYEAWVDAQEAVAAALPARHRGAAARHLTACRECAARMRDGLHYVRKDAQAADAFRLANRAVLLQQLAGAGPPRAAVVDEATGRVAITPAYQAPDLATLSKRQGQWRAFQIAFLLMSLRSAADGTDPHRETVELIWFPTGGGKTEAYLGLAAFGVFMRRLTSPDDAGTHVLTRYTLRLLTAQQFQRAARLVCAMEQLRRERPRELGLAPVSIGVWLGGETTPNRREDALEALRKLQQGDRYAENLFLLDRCPWCKAPMGPLARPAGKGGGNNGRNNGRGRGGRRGGRGEAATVLGYEQRGDTVALCCPDPSCPFAAGLPVYVTDEDIYAERPTVVVGTVDKFAMLAWRPEARALFGLAPNGTRTVSPPGLIIQDELHLIAGPLGSMVGLYELVIEELCTDRRGGAPVRPKLVCSTATIRRYPQQVKALYNRDAVTLFPPPGLDAGDSFFARYERRADGTLAPGRCYVGVHAPGLGSLQTAQVRTLASLLQAAVAYDTAGRDPWWTLLVFFNSLRELGGTLSLIQSDIPDYLVVLQNRLGLTRAEVRRIREVLELTSRLRSDEVPRAIAQLEADTTAGRPVDICLASNIIEVGVDIDRLSLMAVVGQPKTTAQYIQVTGRVGRRTRERPGLVVTIYSASKARDRSHYEKFRSYHERLYAQVEPTSVTPFSRPVLERALHGAMAAFVRQTGDANAGPSPYPAAAVGEFHDLIRARVDEVDHAELARFDQVFGRRASEWLRWAPQRWAAAPGAYEPPLLRFGGAYVDAATAAQSWQTPSSMRNVDAQCQIEVSSLYSGAAGGPAAGSPNGLPDASATGPGNGGAAHV